MPEIVMRRSDAMDKVNNLGISGFLSVLSFRYPWLGLYQISTSWLWNPQYVCKAKGADGDLIITWEQATLFPVAGQEEDGLMASPQPEDSAPSSCRNRGKLKEV